MLRTSLIPAALTAMAILLLAVPGCGDAAAPRDASAAPAGPVVAATVPPHAWLARRIGGEEVEVLVALSGIASCHDGAPPDAAVVALSRAELFFTAGIVAEDGPWLAAVLRSGDVDEVDLLAAAREGLPAELAAIVGEDAHAWTDPASLRRQAAAIAAAMSRQWPERAATFTANAAALDAELAALEQRVDEQLAGVRGGTIVVDHPAWTWLAATHGIRQIAVMPESGAASDRSLQEIRELMLEGGLRTIIAQPQHDPRSSLALAETVEARLVTLDPMAADVVAGIRAAAEAIPAAAVGGTPPEAGADASPRS